MAALMSLGDNMADITGRKDSPKPPNAPSGLGRGYDVTIMDDMQKPNALKHDEYIVERKRIEMEKAEVSFREARDAFEKFKHNHIERRQKQLELIRERAARVLDSFSGDNNSLFQISSKADVEESVEGYWVECRVWVRN
jgi:hypothetical protein